MIKKQLRNVNDLQKYLENLTEDEVEKNLLKEDFYTYDTQHKEGFPLFENQSKPQRRIFNLIQDHEFGSFEEYDQIQNQIMRMTEVDWNYNRMTELKEKYVHDRSKIIMSKIKIKQIMHLVGDKIDFNEKDPVSLILKSYLNLKSNENKLIWEFLDSIFNALDNQLNEQVQQISSVEYQRQELNQGMNKSIFCEKTQKSREVIEMFRKLSILLKPNFDQELSKEIQLNLNEND